jgi:hypothetical protein
MWLWVRRITVVLTSVGFLTGGFARLAMAVAPAEPCHGHQQSPTHPDHDDAMHASHAGHHQDHGIEQSAPVEGACFKCCGICTAAPNLADPAARIGIRLIGHSVGYFVEVGNYGDRPLVIDPGIPKRIA